VVWVRTQHHLLDSCAIAQMEIAERALRTSDVVTVVVVAVVVDRKTAPLARVERLIGVPTEWDDCIVCLQPGSERVFQS
jgi:hypothetical protein